MLAYFSIRFMSSVILIPKSEKAIKKKENYRSLSLIKLNTIILYETIEI